MAAATMTTGGTPAGGLVSAKGTPMPPSPSALALQAQAARRRDLDDAWKHYMGDVPGVIRPEAGQPDVNVRSNRCSTVVDIGIDFLFGRPAHIVVDDDTPNPDAAQAYLDGCWGNERRQMTLYAKLAQNGGVFGHVFAKIVPPNPAKQRPYARVVPLDPSQVTVETDPQDCDTVLCYSIEWNSQDALGMTQSHRQDIRRCDPDDDADLYDRGEDPDSTWMITNWVRGGGTSASWAMVGAPIEWPHPWAPVVDWQNMPLANQHWGMSDIPADVRHLNDVLNFVLSNVNAIGKSHAHPWLWSAGMGPTDTIEAVPGKVIQLHSTDAKLAALEAHGDLAGLMAFTADLRSDMDEQTRVPGVATGRFKELPRVTSGVALQMLFGPLLAKTLHKQNTYGEGLATLSTRMLALGGFGDGTEQGGAGVRIKWSNPLPTDDLALAQVAVIKQQIGFSATTLIEDLGGDPDVEQARTEEEQARQVTRYAQGTGLPPTGAPGDEPGQAPAGEGEPQPPVNHPAAVAARAAMATAVKG